MPESLVWEAAIKTTMLENSECKSDVAHKQNNAPVIFKGESTPRNTTWN